MEYLISCQHMFYTYHTLQGETPALCDIDFQVKPGEFLSIVGPSGCGKSTLLSLLCGLIQPESGKILLNGQNVTGKCSIGYMLQHDHLFEWRTVKKNILLGLEIQKKINKETLKEADELLKTYGLYDFKDARPSQLSGGMRQRAALIRTLLLHPDLLLLDEPFSALDYQTRLQVSDDIGSIIRKSGKTAILVTHDLSEAVSLGDRVLVLTPLPAGIKAIIPINFPPELSPLQRRNTNEFKDYFNLIWKELNLNEL
ncbi:MAG: ABC transporter ATP-binding protein [Lachnospiraceae bacterium]|nr:ABC transporter ATP-binding protein [Lachnospiraceae bacterium]MDE6982419.1 ABC transporter ATP-binding protein [Lachnospiraceae bacterium]